MYYYGIEVEWMEGKGWKQDLGYGLRTFIPRIAIDRKGGIGIEEKVF